MGGILGSIIGAIVNSLIEKVFKPLVMNIYKRFKRKQFEDSRTKEQIAAEEFYTQVLDNPASTEQEKTDAYEQFINSGRHKP